MSSHLLVPAPGLLRRGWVTLAPPAASWWWPLWTEEEQERFLVLQQQEQADEQTAAGTASLLVFEKESAWQEGQAPLSAHAVDMFTSVEEVEGTDQRVQLVVKNPSGVALQFSAEEDGGVGDWLNALALHIAGLRRQAQQRPPATPAPATPPRVVNLAHRAYNWLYPADTESVSSYSENASDLTPGDEAVTAVTNAEDGDGRDEEEELRSGHTASQRGLLRRLLRPRGAIWLTTGSSHQLSGSAQSSTQITGSMRHGGRRGRMRRGRCQSNRKAVARWQRIKCATLPPALGGCSGVCEHCGQENCDGACLPRHIVERWGKMVTSWYSLQIARSGDVDDVRRFLNRFPDFKGVDNMFRAAIRFKHYALVEYFLDEVKIDVNVRNGSGMPACWFAAIFLNKSDGGAMMQYLINRGAIVDSVNNWGMTMIHLLATADPAQSLPMMRTLHTTHGIRLDTVDDYGSAPVHWAALNGHVETVQYLTEMCGCHAPRANWSAILNELSNLRLIRPEHKEAQRAWRVKGLGALAASATPLAVAVLHSHAQVAQWLMGYGPGHSVKCMRDKRALLFQDQCHDLRMVAKTWPELLPEVLNSFGSDVVKNSHFTAQDGRLERASEFFNIRSATASGGWVERIYDVKLLYGEPDIPASNTPLSILLDTHYAPVFDLPVVKLIIQLKWTLYGGSYYMWELMRYFGTVITFYMGFIWLGNSSAAHAKAIRIACWALTAYNLVFEEGRELLHSPSARAYFGSSWNRQSLVTYTLTLALAPLYYLPTSRSGFELDAPNGPPLAQRMMVAPAALALFLRALEHLAIWRSTSIYIAVIRNMLISTAWWGLLFAIFQLAFSVAFYALLKGEPGYGSLGSTIVTVFAMSTGQIDQPFSDDTALNAAASVLLILFVMLVAVLQLNLLIAMLTCSYESMMDKAPAQTLMHKAETLLKWEGGMHPRQRHRFYRIINPKPGTQRRIKLNKLFSGMSRSEVFVYNTEARVVEQKKGVVLTGHLQLLNRLDALCSKVDELLQQGVGHQQRGAAGQLQHQESKTLEEVAKDADTAARSRGSASTMLGIFQSGFAAPAGAAASETVTGVLAPVPASSQQQQQQQPPSSQQRPPQQRPPQLSQQRLPQQQQQQQQQRRRAQGGSPRSLRLQFSSASSRSLAATSTSSLETGARDGGANGNAQQGDGAVERSSAQGRAIVARHSSSNQRGGSRRVSTGEGSDGGGNNGFLRRPMVSWLQWRGGGASGTSERSVSTEELNDWRQRAMESLARQESRRAAVRVQAAVRGHLQRQRLRAQMNGSKV